MVPKQMEQSNLEVDYVISYRFTEISKSDAQRSYEQLIQALARVGLEIEVRSGEAQSLLLFIKARADESFHNAIYRMRVKDWLHGVRAAQPDKEAIDSLTQQPLSPAERLRLVHHIITSPRVEGGAGITPREGEWKNVESLFALHDVAFNREWIKTWSMTTFLQAADLDRIREMFGEKIAFYFAFTQSYFAFLLFPAAFGASAYLLLGHFSPIYAVVSTLWCVVFVEYWKKQEVDLAIRWGVKGVSEIQERRKEFQAESEVQDPITGETVQTFSAAKRLARQALQVPFALLAVLALGTLIATCFGIEVFLSEVYHGPFKAGLIYLPTGLLTTLVPTLTSLLTGVATQLNDYENWDTTAGYEASLTQKIFVLNFITSYLPVFLTAFVYVPFGSIIVPYLDVFHLAARPFAEHEKQLHVSKAAFEINPSRLRKQVIYVTVTAQVVNFLLEVIVPYVKRRAFRSYSDMKAQRAVKKGGATSLSADDAPEEADFLRRVRNEAELDVYDVTVDLREMVVQFGYLALFSVVWPLTPVSFIINNWIELRSDAVKICIEMQRPTPYRADTIGPWLDSLSFLAWLGSITTAALVYLFRNDGVGPDGHPSTIHGWALLLAIFFSEHIYLLVRLAVRLVLSKLDSPGMQKERAEKYMLRKRYLEETFGENAMTAPPPPSKQAAITRQALEDEARQASLGNVAPEQRFWGRQRGWEETAQVGARLIDTMAADEGKKMQ